MQITNNFYNAGYIKQSPGMSVPKTFASQTAAKNMSCIEEEQKTQKKVAFKGAAAAADALVMPSNVASAMIFVINQNSGNNKNISVSYNVQAPLFMRTKEIEQAVYSALQEAGINKSADELLSVFGTDSAELVKKLNNSDITSKDFIGAFESIKSEAVLQDDPQTYIEERTGDLLKTVEIAKDIKSIKGLDAFPLSLIEADKIRIASMHAANRGTDELSDVLCELNDKYNILDDVQVLEWSENANKIADDVNTASDRAVYKKIPDDKKIKIEVNGREKFITFISDKNIKISPRAKIPEDAVECMIKSNLVTQELFDAYADYSKHFTLKEEYKSNVKLHGNDETVKSVVNTEKLFERLQNEGIESLTSHEVHVLTDVFLNQYRKDAKFASIVNKTVQKSSQAMKLYNFSLELKKIGKNVADRYGVKVDDHFYMRMIDRNLISPVDFGAEQPKPLKFEETLEKVIKSVLEVKNPKNKDNTSVSHLNGDGLNVIFEFDRTCSQRKLVSVM